MAMRPVDSLAASVGLRPAPSVRKLRRRAVARQARAAAAVTKTASSIDAAIFPVCFIGGHLEPGARADWTTSGASWMSRGFERE